MIVVTIWTTSRLGGGSKRRLLATIGFFCAILLLSLRSGIALLLQDPNFYYRLGIYQAYWQAFLQSPWIGSGLLNVEIVKNSEAMGQSSAYMHAHNLLLQILADTGLFGLALMFAMLWTVFRRTLRSSADCRRAGLLVWCGMIIHGLVEPNYFSIYYNLFFMASLGVLAMGETHPMEANND